ncbi:MAG: VCBS repeat-containing protein [Alphaproteobacteria bacterium]|nr:VCBS repeat-containing protein [Alphaproteobacteria bacterium]
MRISEIGHILGSIFGIGQAHSKPPATVPVARDRVNDVSSGALRVDFDGDGRNEVSVENQERTRVSGSGRGSTKVLASQRSSGSVVGLDVNSDGRPDFRVSVSSGVGAYGNVRQAVDETSYRVVVPGGVVVGRDQTSLIQERNSRGDTKVEIKDRKEVEADIAGKGRLAYASADTTTYTREVGNNRKSGRTTYTQSNTTAIALDRNRDGKNEGAAVFTSSISLSGSGGAKVSVTSATSQSAQISGTKILGGGSSSTTLLPV